MSPEGLLGTSPKGSNVAVGFADDFRAVEDEEKNMRSRKGLRAVTATVVTALAALASVLFAPSASAAQGCSTIPSFCAWEEYNLQGNVITVTNPQPSLLGSGVCYDLKQPRLSAVNDTAFIAVMHADRNCGLLITSSVLPGQLIKLTLPFQSVSFLPV
jgi:hypothetical protein